LFFIYKNPATALTARAKPAIYKALFEEDVLVSKFKQFSAQHEFFRVHLPSTQQVLHSLHLQTLVAGTQQQAEAQQVLPEMVHFPPTQQVLQSTQTQSL